MDRELLRQKRAEMGLTQDEMAEALNVANSTYQRWETGEAEPHPVNQRQLHQFLGVPMKDLIRDRRTPGKKNRLPDLSMMGALVPENFAIRLQCIACTPGVTSQQVQRKIAQAIEEHLRMHTTEHAAMSRRDALQNLALFFALFQGKSTKLSPEETINLCSAGITASGYLSHGSHEDMKLAFATLNNYTPALQDIITSSSRYGITAISLISQALQIKAILASHLEGSQAAIRYAQEAVNYAKASNDVALDMMAVRQLANRYRQSDRYDLALRVAEEAHVKLEAMDEKEREERIPPYLQSWFYAGMCIYAAYDVNRKQQALTSMTKAYEQFDVPLENQLLPGYVSHNKTNLIHGEGLMYSFLGAPEKGLAAYEKVIDFDHDQLFAKLPTAQRTHIGGIIDAAMVSLRLPMGKKNKELSKRLWSAGIQGAITLKSEEFFSDSITAYNIMGGIWSGEQDITDLRDLIRHW